MESGSQANPCTKGWNLLTEVGYPYSGMLAELLRSHAIPFVAQDSMGAGLTLKIGLGAERTRFYVPCGLLVQAKALVNNIFS